MNENRQYDVIIIGAGPAGIFTALEMTERKPGSRVLIVDTGRQIKYRACPARINGQCAHCDPCAIVHGQKLPAVPVALRYLHSHPAAGSQKSG